MNKTFWLEPGRIAGRSGPNREPWNATTLHAAGIGAVLSVNDGAMCHREEFEALGVTYECVPLPDNTPPQPADKQAFVVALARTQSFIEAQVGQGRAVLVHCSAGKDRTGIVMAHYLMRRDGLDPEQAIAAVRRVRPFAISSMGWEALALAVLRECS